MSFVFPDCQMADRLICLLAGLVSAGQMQF